MSPEALTINYPLINELFDYILEVLGIRLCGYVAKWSPYPSTYRLPPLHPTEVVHMGRGEMIHMERGGRGVGRMTCLEAPKNIIFSTSCIVHRYPQMSQSCVFSYSLLMEVEKLD